MKQKFRAWQKYHKKMVEVTSISFGNDGEINGVSTFVENQAPQRVTYKDGLGDFFLTDERGMVLELMQYTGLDDKNGLGIFEKDIVKITVDDGFNYIDSVGFVDWHEKEREYAIFLGGEPWRRLSVEDEIEVIGDIYQNKDLLEG